MHSDNLSFCVQFRRIADKVQDVKGKRSCTLNLATSQQQARIESDITNIGFVRRC